MKPVNRPHGRGFLDYYFERSFNVGANEQGIAAGGILVTVRPVLQPGFVFKMKLRTFACL